MKPLFIIMALLLFSVSASAQMRVHFGATWDDGESVTGTITLGHNCTFNSSTSLWSCSNVDFTSSFSGWRSTSFAFQQDVFYLALLNTTNPLTGQAAQFSVPVLLPSALFGNKALVSATFKTVLSRNTNQSVPAQTSVAAVY